MKQIWAVDELGEFWTLSSAELELVERRRRAENCLGFAHQLKCYQCYARFLDDDRDIPADITEYLIDQIGDGTAKLDAYEWGSRTGRRHRLEILKLLGVRDCDEKAETRFRVWLINEMLPQAPSAANLADQITHWFLTNRVDRPTSIRNSSAVHHPKLPP